MEKRTKNEVRTRVISKGLVKLFISFSYHGFFRVIFLKTVKFDISKMPKRQYLFSGQKPTRRRKNNGKKNKKLEEFIQKLAGQNIYIY